MPATTASPGYSRPRIALHRRGSALIERTPHVTGAPYHQFILRDGTLARMRRAQD